MKMENKRAAQEKRAQERKKRQRNALIQKVIIVAVIVAAVACMVGYGIWESRSGSSSDNGTAANASDTSQSASAQESTSSGSDEEVENGDVVAIHYVGSVDGVEFDGGTGDYNLEIGSGAFIPGFEEQLIGAHVGDTVDVNVTFPEQYQAAELAGKDALFKVTINGIN